MRPLIIETTEQFAESMRLAREELGISGEALDTLCGWPDRYTAKAENPEAKWGRVALKLSENAQAWMIALGHCLVLMPVEQARAICASDHERARANDSIRVEKVYRLTIHRR